MRELLPRSIVVALASCLVLACGGKTVGGELPGDDSSSGASSSGGSSGSTSSSGASSSGTSSGGGSSSGTTSSSGTGSSGSSSGATVSCVYVGLSTYDRSCQQPSDCIDVAGGEVCDSECDCPADLVNSSERGRYDQAISAIQFGLCACSALPPPQCVDQVCTRMGPSVDAGAPDEGPPDAGVCVDVDLSTYDTSCQLDSDCIEITAGILCTAQCDCGGSTINSDGAARYEAAVAPVRFNACPCSVGAPLRCIQNQCTRCAFGLDVPPGCDPDGG